MAQDLRSFLEQVKRKRPTDVQVVTRAVDPAHELTALVVKLEKERKQRPILLFEMVCSAVRSDCRTASKP